MGSWLEDMKLIMKKIVFTASLFLCVSVLTGCASQIAALKPVGGDDLAGVRTATIDMVISRGYGFLEAPVCAQSDTQISCVGSTTDNQEVTSLSDLDGNKNVTIKIGADTIYQGSITEVLEKAARGEL